MQRRPSTQDITWLLDLNAHNQLDLSPPYQRRSVWTKKDKQYFLDTIFRNYPSPAIFLHKTTDDTGRTTYHVVDGKQRLQTILDFVSDRIRLGSDFGDARLDGRLWQELAGIDELRQRFWNYQITVEQIDLVEGTVVNEVFDRLNRNARRLTPQELRHAKFEGWLISNVENEATREDWITLGVVTKARSKRMIDCQFISELMLLLLEGRMHGFDQQGLDDLYAKFDDLAETAPELNEDEFLSRFDFVKNYLLEIERLNQSVTIHAKGFGNFYSLWALVALTPNLPPYDALAARYAEFMQRVSVLADQEDVQAFIAAHGDADFGQPLNYLINSRGASTDLPQRTARLASLRAGVGLA